MTTSRTPDAAFLVARPAHFLALGFGSGLAPVAPGTFGSLAAYPVWYALSLLPEGAAWAAVVAGFAIGVWACAVTGRDLGVADHGAIVWDEMVAMCAILLATPPGLVWWIAAFFLFRLFDIWKPFPVGLADRRLKNGFGVMFDDALAAAYTIACVRGGEMIVNGGI